jgi:hypothetical protein
MKSPGAPWIKDMKGQKMGHGGCPGLPRIYFSWVLIRDRTHGHSGPNTTGDSFVPLSGMLTSYPAKQLLGTLRCPTPSTVCRVKGRTEAHLNRAYFVGMNGKVGRRYRTAFWVHCCIRRSLRAQIFFCSAPPPSSRDYRLYTLQRLHEYSLTA